MVVEYNVNLEFLVYPLRVENIYIEKTILL